MSASQTFFSAFVDGFSDFGATGFASVVGVSFFAESPDVAADSDLALS